MSCGIKTSHVGGPEDSFAPLLSSEHTTDMTFSVQQSYAFSTGEEEVVYWNDLRSLKPEAAVHMQSSGCGRGCGGGW